MITIDVKKRLHTAEGPMDLEFCATVEQGEFTTLFGPSGAGKTTLLRMVAGLMTPDAGQISVAGQLWFDSTKRINLTPRQRSIGMVFQDYALFPNLSVASNIGLALPKEKRSTIVSELLDVAGLQELAGRKPDKLSGGQRQRVALARALALKPTILLLDEPLSALDLQMRLKLQDELLRLHQRYQPTTLLVSHDMSEVFRLSQRVFVLNKGQLVRSGKPTEVFSNSQISNKFRFSGEIVHIEPSGVVSIVHVLVGQDIVQVVASEQEMADLSVGKRVLIASKAFNPLIMPLQDG